jgi:asparagine N-glycosylation enzyme membrane subunit Stt3
MNEGSSEETFEGLKKTYSFFKKRFDVVAYVLLFFVVYLALWIRTRNLPGLRDITTGGWTLGPDLDPFLFLRWSKDIVENGSLFVVDPLRYIPLGYHTNGELVLLPHLMAWFHNFLSIFSNISIEHSAALFPVVMFGLTVISFFILTRELFRNSLSPQKANYAALISSVFLSIFPSILPRTIAGIPEKESAAFFFMFTAFYFFIKSWNSHGKYKNYLFALISSANATELIVYILWLIGKYIASLSLGLFLAPNAVSNSFLVI